ncbi:6-bladed beta-propeller [Desertivirga arenae]|uniref:6-bladed beta-propeller n=1 Tax=Desertivirga arenae TaxID=2810309 RepID=UPI001A974855|nr:6-bladed beta-propeller [Pedobacter sp. SYSU D00823]
MIFFNHLPYRAALFVAFSICLLSSYVFPQAKIDSSTMQTLRIDPQTARGAKVSQIFDDVRFIPLETTKESLFGTVYTLQIVKNQFVIFDYDTKAVLIFARDGKFKGKIDASKIPKDANDKTKNEFYGYKIVEENKDSVIAIYSNKYLFYFDLAGKQVKKELSKNSRYFENYPLADKETSVRPGFVKKNGKDSTYYEFAILGKKDTLCYFPYSIKRYEMDEFWDHSKIYNYGVENELFFINMHEYNIHRITPGKLSLAYRILFPANNSLPKDWLTNPDYIKKRSEYFQNNQKVFYSLNNVYQTGDFLYFQMRSFSWDRENKKALIYNLKTTELLSIQDLEPDPLSHFLPVTDASAFYDFANHGFLLYKDNYFYTSYSSLAMFTFKEQLGDKNKEFSPALQEYFKTQNRRSNPVIIQLKPKKQ